MQLENLHIVDEDRRIFEGIATIEMADNTGIIVPIDEVEAYMDRYLSRGGTLSLEHTNQHVGKVLEYWRSEILITPELISRAVSVNPKIGHLVRQYEGKTLPAIEVRAQIFKDYPFENEVWERIRDPLHPQPLRGLSFGGRSAPVSYDEERKGIVHTVRAAWEFAVCGVPRVALALLTGVNELAQSDNERELLQSALVSEQTCSHCGGKVGETKQDNAMSTTTTGANNPVYGKKPIDQEMRSTETLNKPKNEGDSMPKPDETDSKDTLPEEKVEEVTESQDLTAEPGPSEERSEAPQSATVDALAAEIAEIKSRMAALEERLAPAAPAALEVAADPAAPVAPLEEAAPEEKAAEDALAEEAPAEGAEAPADEEKPAPFEKKDEDEETKQATPKTRSIESDARGELEIKQALQSPAPKYDAAAIARGEKQVSFVELRGNK